MRIFNNPNQLPQAVAFSRVRTLDLFAECIAYNVLDENAVDRRYFIAVESDATDLQLLNLFSTAQTEAETTQALQRREYRQAIKDEYQNMITRLDQIQAAVNPTNAQVVQAIKDEALYIERIMKEIKNIIA